MSKGIRYSSIIVDGLDNVFYCWSRVKSFVKGVEEEFRICRAQEFWIFTNKERKYTDFISRYFKPANYITVSLRSKELFRFGVFELRAKLPRIVEGPMLWFGFELDDLFGGGVIHFMWHTDKGVLMAFAGGFSHRVEMDLTKHIPSDVSVNYHLYKIIYREGLALWYIDEKLRAIAILGTGNIRDSMLLYNNDPYIIGFTRDAPSASLPILLDIDGGNVEKPFEWLDIHPWNLRVSEGDPKTTIYLDLYLENSNTILKGYSVENEIISAPFPATLNYKEILFATKDSGILIIEGFTNGQWFEYKEIAIEGNKLYSIHIQNKTLMSRLRFRPKSSTKIIEAQTILQ